MKSKEYKALKNLIHNELGITKEDLIHIIRLELSAVARDAIKNIYGSVNIEQIIQTIFRQEISRMNGGGYVQSSIANMARKIVEEEYEITIVPKIKHK